MSAKEFHTVSYLKDIETPQSDLKDYLKIPRVLVWFSKPNIHRGEDARPHRRRREKKKRWCASRGWPKIWTGFCFITAFILICNESINRKFNSYQLHITGYIWRTAVQVRKGAVQQKKDTAVHQEIFWDVRFSPVLPKLEWVCSLDSIFIMLYIYNIHRLSAPTPSDI